MAGVRYGVRLIGVILVAGALAGCGNRNAAATGEAPENTGFWGNVGAFFASKPDVDYSTYEPKALYELAEQTLEVDGDTKQAIVLFQEVERLYPYTEWAKRALVMQAYALHKSKAYEESRIAAQRYLDFYPADEDAAYAQYLLALSYYDQIDEVGRDQGLTYQALQSLRTVIEQYPDSDYAASSMMKFDLAFDHLAGKEMEIGRYYLKRGNYAAAINRFRVVVADYQTTTHTPEALMRLVEAYLALGFADDAQTAGAILGYNYQSSPFYDDAYALLTKAGLKPEVKGTGWLTSVYRQMVRGEWL
ncbi:outer membrane protein assembly factor BamD [Neotabrizicola shimadae]|uniref:Outer membrane protein assembly factor BamD n=1 Tax=Neotabrizicola shimadae TaxID=2807096 RepID=A0A8G0ZUV9_9RHOB|nr:outer membrane protein assembly factor BamD [Neotabrizicola shimadae]QYZ68484.1 outer membrane protein assembly factor BamD [Neotabrizicola shimadae]